VPEFGALLSQTPAPSAVFCLVRVAADLGSLAQARIRFNYGLAELELNLGGLAALGNPHKLASSWRRLTTGSQAELEPSKKGIFSPGKRATLMGVKGLNGAWTWLNLKYSRVRSPRQMPLVVLDSGVGATDRGFS
jgi:hypothetical protein